MNKVGVCLVFLSGVIVGSGTTAYFLNKRHQQEVESVKEAFGRYAPPKGECNQEEKTEDVIENDEVPDFNSKEMKEARSKYKSKDYEEYVDYTKLYSTSEKVSEPAREEVEDQTEKPCAISPDEFGDYSDYNTISLIYFADGIVAERSMEIVDNPEFHLGKDFESHFGEFEDDAAHFRNDTTRCYYEVLRDERDYADAAMNEPGLIDF